MSETQLTSPYGLIRDLGAIAFDKAREATEAALKQEGFGVLTEIDVKGTLKKKIDADMRPYLILGACSPQLAYQALQHEHYLGLLLPCNVVLSEQENGAIHVSAIDPVKMFEVVGRDDIQPIADEVRGRLERVLAAIEV